ncbi:MAG: potassium channel protein [Desulfobacteraceae bacterium]|nr:potassium channel protein [Desulfobacteraceae bacterium]
MDQRQKNKLSSRSDLTKIVLQQLVWPVLLLVGAFIFGTVGFLIIGGDRWTVLDCAYMTSITLTTVGYGEVLEHLGTSGRIFCMVVMWWGMGVTLYAISAITGCVVEQNLTRIFRERKMEKRIAALRDHYIVCGVGKTGFNVLRELVSSRRPCVAIELKPDRVDWLAKQFDKLHYLQGDATEEEVLRRAGIEKAAGILTTLGDDSHNLLIMVQARYVNPSVKIVARCQENSLTDKFYRAGANYVVNPAFIGGMRMASEMVRPHVVSFLDRMLRGRDKSVRVEEVTICAGSPWAGHTISEVEMQRKTELLPISMKPHDGDDFSYNPPLDTVLQPGTVVIVIGNPDQITKLKSYCSGPEGYPDSDDMTNGEA